MVDRRLGRGLDFFLSGGRGGNPPAAPATTAAARSEATASAKAPQEEILLAPLGQLRPSPYQPRKTIGADELKELAASIGKSGLLQPILARRQGDHLEIVAGERRWRAAQLAGLSQVPVLIRSISDKESAVFGLVENLQREDLNAIEKARGFRLLMDQLGATQEDVATQVGLDRSTVANFLRLLDLPPAVQEHVSRGTLSMGHARSLLALPDADAMVVAADEAIRAGLSVRSLEARVKEALEASKGKPTKSAGTRARPVWLNELEESLVESLGTPVTIRYGRKRSQIVIDCAGRDEFERVFQRLKGS
ncbi:MAG: ParB/RepB/Spo0J family partition protein [Planctomycetes bacterium]|nr:ParB/RepB/Spo0J family partition protein [Planctomycetota bacterium]